MRFEYRLFRSERPFGVELECSNTVSQESVKRAILDVSEKDVRIAGQYEQSLSNSYWHIKPDSTCGPRSHLEREYGVELASYKARGLQDIIHIAQVAEHLSSNGVEVNDNCGFHIHAEATDYSPAQAGVMLANWIKVEPVMCLLVPPRRTNNKYCKLWTKFKRVDPEESYQPEQFWEIMRPTDFRAYNNTHKRVTLNFVNYASALEQEARGLTVYRKTVELRLPEGTLVRQDICNWIKLYLLFMDTNVKSEMPSNLLPVDDLDQFFKVMGFSNSDSFSFLSRGLYDVKKWTLNKIINSTATDRRSQKFIREAKETLKTLTEAKKR